MEELKNLDLNLCTTFLTVAKLGSISKAASELYVSQPAISHGIKLLEDNLECKLFNRTSKGVELTVEATKLKHYIESAYDILETGIKRIHDSNDLLEGEITIGVPTHICTFFVSDIIETFNKEYPGIKFIIVSKSTAEMVYMLERKQIDIIIDSYPIDTSRNDVEIVDLLEVDNCFIAGKKYKKLLKQNKETKITDLKQFRLLLQPETTSTRKALETIDENDKVNFRPSIEVATTEVMLSLVKKGLGIGYFARMSIVDELHRGNVIEIPVKEKLPKTKICMAYIEDFLMSASKEFIKEVKKKAKMLEDLKEKTIRLILLQDCMYNCSFCHKEGIRDKRKSLLSPQDIRYMFKAIRDNYAINTVHLTGGEPLMRKDLKDIILNLKQENAIVKVTSNGYLLKENMWIGKLIDEINISLYSMNKEKYESISMLEQSYDKVIKAIKELRFRYPTLKININTTLIKNINDNIEDIKEIAQFACSIKADLKIIEILPNGIKEYINLDKIISIIRKLGYTSIGSSFRKQLHSNGRHTIILQKCTCSVVSEAKDKVQTCKVNNDIYITQDGKINLCRNSEEIIDLYPIIKERDDSKLINKVQSAYKLMGNQCKYCKY